MLRIVQGDLVKAQQTIAKMVASKEALAAHLDDCKDKLAHAQV